MAAQGAPPTAPQMEMIRPSALRRDHAARRRRGRRAWLEAVAQHHERAGGGGYPDGLNEVGELPTVLRYIDVFMAKMAPRALRAPLAHAGGGAPALPGERRRAGLGGHHQGVRHLSAGRVRAAQVRRLAVVVRRAADARTPLAASVTDRHGMPSVNTVLRDTARAEFAITGLAPDKNMVLRLPPGGCSASRVIRARLRPCPGWPPPLPHAPRLPRRPGSSGGSA